jgi:hypothetical protein
MKSGNRTILRSSCLFITLSVFTFIFIALRGDLLADSYGEYIGVKGCQDCHGELVSGWQKTQHARAFDDLKKSKQEGLPDCQRCHVIGYGETGGFIDYDLTPELVNVQCEECHGAGKVHAADPGEKGSIIAKPGEQKCRKCHTPGQDKSFDYAKKIQGIHGPKQ